jgi:tetratricopeptide (TPR) repeat protein
LIFLIVLLALAAGQDCPDAAAARAAYDARRYDQAVVEFTRAVTACGASSPLLLALAQSQVLAKRPADAVASLDRIPQDDPDYVQGLKVKARALYLLARDPEAEAVLKRAAARAPADAEIPYHLGRLCYQQGKHVEAAESFRRAIALDPGAFRAWDNLGLALEALGEVTEAQQHYLKAIALVHKDHPTYDVVYANFAELMIKLGSSQRAFDLAVEAAQRNPDEPRNFFLAGKALVQAGRSDVSVKWFEQAIVLNPDYPEPHYQLSQVYRRLGRADDAQRALKAFQAATARAPKNRR